MEGNSTATQVAGRSDSLKAAALTAAGLFFAYRLTTVLSPIYAILAGSLIALAMLSWLRRLPARLQNLALSSAVSLVFLDLAFYQIDLSGMLEAMRGINYLFLIPSTALIVLAFFVRSYRWGWFFRPKRVPFTSLLSGLCIGIAANMILPARAGEFIRAFVLGRREGLSKTTVFATVVLERIFDGLTVLLCLLLVVALIGVHSPEMQYMGVAGALFYLGAIVAIVAVHFKAGILERWARRLLPGTLGERVVGLLHAFAEGLASIRNIRQLAMIALLSLVAWIVMGASFWPVLVAFDFGPDVPFYTVPLLISTLGLALMIPAAPAGIGVFQYACLLALRIAFAPYAMALATDFNEKAVAFSLVAHLSQALPEILMGFIFFLFEGLRLQDVRADL